MTTTQTSFAGGVVLLSSTLDDATATQLGLKQYYHGTTYNGGNAPTTTSGQAGFSVVRALFIPSQMQDGSWRVKFNIVANFTSASISGITLSVANLVFKNTTNFFQPISGFFANGTVRYAAYINPNTGDISLTAISAETTNRVYFSGDVELNAKPTWAY